MTRQEFIDYWMNGRLDDLEEHAGEVTTQYQSECALFGDAGPGQGITVRELNAEIRSVKARLRAFGCRA